MSSPTQVADAVVAALNAIEWPEGWPEDLAFTAVRSHAPTYLLADTVAEFIVCAAPVKETRKRVSRRSRVVKNVIDIGIMKKLPPSPSEHEAAIELLGRLPQFLVEYFGDEPRPLAELPHAVIADDVERDPVCDADLVRDNSQFASVVRLTISEAERW